jgi:hypothetical protein
VAVICATCSAAIEANPNAPRIPEPTDIGITERGEVLRRRGHADREASHRLSRLLFELLEGERMPSQLRLLISTRIGGSPHPVQQFARDLEFFARPDGPSLIQALYARFHLGTQKAARIPPPVPAVVPKAKPRVRAQPRRGRRLALVALIALVAGAAGAWAVWSQRDPATPDGGLGAAAGRLQATIGDLRTAAGDLGRSLGLPIPLAETDAADAAAGAEAPPPAPAAPVAQAAAAAPPPAAEAGDTAPAEAGGAVAQEPAQTPELQTPVEPSGDAPVEAPGPIYSAEDVGVEPPVMTYPQVPPPAPGASDVRRLQVIVSVTGEVEQALMVPPARRLIDVMLVSNAKAWRFAPARLDGRPVRYQLVVDWALGPGGPPGGARAAENPWPNPPPIGGKCRPAARRDGRR